MRTRSPAWSRLIALGATLVLALGAVACGSSDDGGNGDSGGGASSSSDEAAVRDTITGLYAAMADGDAEGVCARLTPAAQKQVSGGGLGKKGGDCARSFQRFLDQAEQAGGLDLALKAKVERVKVRGNKATARMSYGNKAQGDIPLVKKDGEWLLEAVGAG